MPALLPLLLLLGAQAPPEPAPRPNVVLVVLDDLGFSDLRCYGGELATPTIDRLAREGLRFSQFYVSGKCEPSRAELMTGRPWPVAGAGSREGARHAATLGERLQAAGYRTIAIGKWHLWKKPEDRGFHRAYGHLSPATDYFRGDGSFHRDGKLVSVPKNGFYLTDACTDEAIAMLREERAAHPEAPFFLYLAYDAPHAPLQAPAEDIERWRGRFARGWDTLRGARFERQRELGLVDERWELPARPAGLPAWETLDERARELEDLRMAIYAAMVERVDRGLARLLTALEELEVEEDTLVLVLSDNGASSKDRGRLGDLASGRGSWNQGLGWAWLSNTPFRFYKRSLHAGGMASPLIARWPKGLAPRAGWEDTPCHLVDLMPTLLELAGVDPATNEAPLAGVSLAPLLRGEALPERPPIHTVWRGTHALVHGGYKLVRSYGDWELYDLARDRTEVHDLFEAQPARAARLLERHRAWLESMDRNLGLRDDPEPAYEPLFSESGELRAPLGRFEDTDE